MSSEPELRFRDSSWASISAVDFLCVTAGSRGMRPGSRLRPLWLILSLDDPMNYSGGLYASHVLVRQPRWPRAIGKATFGKVTSGTPYSPSSSGWFGFMANNNTRNVGT